MTASGDRPPCVCGRPWGDGVHDFLHEYKAAPRPRECWPAEELAEIDRTAARRFPLPVEVRARPRFSDPETP